MLLMPTGPAGPKQPTHPHTAHQHVTAAHIYWLQGMMQHQMNAHSHALQIMHGPHGPGRTVMSHLGHHGPTNLCGMHPNLALGHLAPHMQGEILLHMQGATREAQSSEPNCNSSSAQMTEAMKNKKESKGKRTADSDVAGPKGNNNIGDNRPLLTL